MLAREIAERARRITWVHVPPEAVETAKLAILDTIGVTLAGATDDSSNRLVRAVAGIAGHGGSLILGTARYTDPLNAALINGTASHALDFDDCSNTLGGHPSSPILAGLWALAEDRGADGGALLSAYVAGVEVEVEVEVETKIARAVNFHHYEKGWHPTAALGTFGAAAACSHLLQLDSARYAAALAIAASLVSGIKANFGTMTKPLRYRSVVAMLR